MFEQLKLPYAFNALEPNIDTATMEIHYGKHHAAYTNNLNDMLKNNAPEFLNKSIDIIKLFFCIFTYNIGWILIFFRTEIL